MSAPRPTTAALLGHAVSFVLFAGATLTLFRALQLPQWLAWSAVVIGLGAWVLVLLRLARRDRLRLNVASTTLLVVAGAVLLAVLARSDDRAETLDHPIVVLEFDDTGRTAFARRWRVHLLQSLATVPSLDPISLDTRGELARRMGDVGLPDGDVLGLEAAAGYEDGRVSVEARLFRAPDGAELWSERFEETYDELWRIELAVLRAVADVRDLPLPDGLEATLRARIPESITVFDAYADVAYAWHAGDSDSAQQMSSASLQDAVESSPSFAPLRALAANVEMTYLFDAAGTLGESQERVVEAVEQAAQTVLDADASVAHAHLALARVAEYRWQAAAARGAFERAFGLDGNDGRLLMAYALFDARMGRCNDAAARADRAGALYPLNEWLQARRGRVYFLCGRDDTALAAYREAQALGYGEDRLFLWWATAHLRRGELRAARDRIAAYEDAKSGVTHLDARAAYLLALLGEPEEAAALVDGLREAREGLAFGPVTWAAAQMALGEYPSALESLRRASSERGVDEDWDLLADIVVNGWGDAVLNEPAFREVRESLRLE